MNLTMFWMQKKQFYTCIEEVKRRIEEKKEIIIFEEVTYCRRLEEIRCTLVHSLDAHIVIYGANVLVQS